MEMVVVVAWVEESFGPLLLVWEMNHPNFVSSFSASPSVSFALEMQIVSVSYVGEKMTVFVLCHQYWRSFGCHFVDDAVLVMQIDQYEVFVRVN